MRFFGDEWKNVLEISSEPGTNTALLGGCVDTDEDEVGFEDALVDVGGEEEVAAAGLFDDVDEAGLVDGEVEVRVVPGVDAGLVQVDDGHGDVGTFERDDGAGGSACKECLSLNAEMRRKHAYRHSQHQLKREFVSVVDVDTSEGRRTAADFRHFRRGHWGTRDVRMRDGDGGGKERTSKAVLAT